MVELLIGDPTKAKQKLGWTPKVKMEELCREMVEAGEGLGPGRDAVAEVGDLHRAVARDGQLGVLRRDGHHDRRLARQRERGAQHAIALACKRHKVAERQWQHQRQY